MSTYQSAWPLYRQLGWLGTLPLPRDSKWPPPTGYTGRAGVDPTSDQCGAFEQDRRYRGTTQLAVRPPLLVKGVDIDGYDGRTGLDTMREGARLWGALPDAPSSSSREDGSGILWFRVAEPVQLVSEIKFPDLGLGHVELVQRHHRYGVVWPSRHPATGHPYTWRGTAGPDVPPAVADLPLLPPRWVDGLNPARYVAPPVVVRPGPQPALTSARVAGVLRCVTSAKPGTRNNMLSWGAGRLFERVRDGELEPATAEELLLHAAGVIHLPHTEAVATIASARRWVLGG